MEHLKYEVEDRTIAELLGVQNFTNEESAMLELVKNAYDAQAKCVTLDCSNGRLVIEDNGIGMSVEDIRNKWMHVGKSNKGYFSLADANGQQRILAGSKGIGRFALARLGELVTMYTKKENEGLIEWRTDWNESILYEHLHDNSFSKHGTKIEINSLRDRWTERRIANLSDYLSITYNNDDMKINILPQQKQPVQYVFQNPIIGTTHVCTIHLVCDGRGHLIGHIQNDEFLDEAKQYCTDLDIHTFDYTVNIMDELSGSSEFDLTKMELKERLEELGAFEAEFYFSLKSSTAAEYYAP